MQVGKNLSLLSGTTEEQIRTAIDIYTSNLSAINMDRLYDELSADDIDIIFKLIEKTKETIALKNGLEDCLSTESLIISAEQSATKVFKSEVHNETTLTNEIGQQK